MFIFKKALIYYLQINIPAQTMTEATIQDALQENFELTFMRSKYPGLKQKSSQPFPYFYQLVPKDEQSYTEKIDDFSNKLKENISFQEDMNVFQAIVLGKIQGMSLSQNPSVELGKLFSYQNRPFWDQQIKEKFVKRNYGLQKQNTHMICQIKDIQKLKQIFDIQQLKKQRKLIKQYSSFYKAAHKFIQKFDKLKSNSEIQELYEEYKKVDQQQTKLNKILTGQKTKTTKGAKTQAPQMQQNAPNAQTTQNIQLQQNKVEQNPNKMDEQVVQERKVQNNQVQANKHTNLEDHQKKQQKQQNNPKPDGKQSKKKAEPKQGTSNKKEKATIDKNQVLKSKYMSLDMFVKKKPTAIQQSNKPTENIDPETEKKVDKTDIFISMLSFSQNQNLSSIQKLRQQFKSQKIKNQNTQTKTCYVNIIMKRSRLQYYDFPVRQPKVDFTDPFMQKCDIRYDDSSDEYSQLIADSINEQMIQQQQEEQNSSESNSAIVSDSFCQYKSSHVFSSEDDSSSLEEQNKIKPQMNKSIGKWFFGPKQPNKKQKYGKYDMELLIQDIMPIITKDLNQQNSNQITTSQKTQMYKQIHGSYTPKQVIIKKLNTIAENKMSMNKISTLMKDICEKKGTQRVLKNQIIKQLAQQLVQINPNLQAEFQQLRSERQAVRNQQIQARRQQKINERDQKLQKMILQYQQNNGNMTTNSILQHLRSTQMKIHKFELNLFIKTKQGQKWDQIRNEIKKNKLTKGKKQKPPKPAKASQQEQIMNTHRPIDQIIKQNQLQMANKPKKLKKVSDIQKQGKMEGQNQECMEEQYHQPSDDQSFQLNKKQKKKGKNTKSKKKIVKISPLLPPIRRNPKRNKKKSKNSKQLNQNQNENENQNCIQNQKNNDFQQQNQNKEQNQINQFEQQMKYEIIEDENVMENQNKEQINQNVEDVVQQNKNTNQVNKENEQRNEAQVVENQEQKNMPIQPVVTPLRSLQLSPQKNQQVNNEKTANKNTTCEQMPQNI